MGGDPAIAGEEPVYAAGYLKFTKSSLTLELALKGATAARALFWCAVCCPPSPQGVVA
jgi:hypothetical protein